MGVCCLQICNSVINMVVMGLVLGQSFLSCYYAKVSPLYYVLQGLLLFTQKINCLQTYKHMRAHWAVKIYIFVKFFYISTRVFEILRETRKTHFN